MQAQDKGVPVGGEAEQSPPHPRLAGQIVRPGTELGGDLPYVVPFAGVDRLERDWRRMQHPLDRCAIPDDQEGAEYLVPPVQLSEAKAIDLPSGDHAGPAAARVVSRR